MLSYCTDDTIVAIASALGCGARGVVRISGPATLSTVSGCFEGCNGRRLSEVATAQCIAGIVRPVDPLGPVACTLLLWPSKRSYTRQVAAELHLIGSLPILHAIQRTLLHHGARLAEPGEFTLRAFLAGRIDLTQAEAVLGIVNASTGDDLNAALTQLAGGLQQPFHRLRAQMLDLLADVEAGLDFADQEIQFIDRDTLCARLRDLAEQIDLLLAQMTGRGQPAHRPRVVLRGWPNTGKSSLLNALCGADVALVSGEHGTTRDYVRVPVDWNGIACELLDTAGHAESMESTLVDVAAHRLADELIKIADVELFCLDATRPPNEWETTILASAPRSDRIVVLTKIDACRNVATGWPAAVATSSRNQAGIRLLRTRVCEHLRRGGGSAPMMVAATLERGRQACAWAAQAIERAADLADSADGDELVAAELHAALEHIGQVAGVVYTDELLDQIFGRFCIGK